MRIFQSFALRIFLLTAIFSVATCCTNTPDDKTALQTSPADTRSAQQILFEDGNYAMFMHFGLYSKFEGEWKGKAYYGNAEWIMNPAQAGIPVEEYVAEAATFNPSNFDAEQIVRLAKDAGMKYIVITAKHHEGFAMFDSKASDFNIMKATALGRDLMAELADACHRNGLGIGFYYSQNQDWTTPGGDGGPAVDSEGRPVDFAEYFRTKCVPQVEELTTKYGEIELIWFDTPGYMGKEYSDELVRIVRKNQPGALISSRVGNDVGDYETLSDMEVPLSNYEGRWEGIDVMQTGWGYSKFDRLWKTPEYVLRHLVSTVSRGGTFMMNVGPKADGSIPSEAAASLRAAGRWVKKYPQVVYAAQASPWGHALPWGDAVRQGSKIYLVVFDWPTGGKLWVPGIQNDIKAVRVCNGTKCRFSRDTGNWTCIDIPDTKPDPMAGVIELELEGEPLVDGARAVDPDMKTVLPVELAQISDCKLQQSSWMENWGEWKFKKNVCEMSDASTACWTMDFQKAGLYDIQLEYKGEGLYEWEISIDSQKIQNRRGSSNSYEWHRVGWVDVATAGTHTISVRPFSGDIANLNFAAISLESVDIE